MPLHGRHRYYQRHLNQWIGMLFAGGASLFAFAGILALTPELAARLVPDSVGVNAVFFAGSIPFTAAAYLQLFQSANASSERDGPEADSPGLAWFAWRPGDINWLACALQFLGTVMFNVNTFAATLSRLDWRQQDLAIWAPDMIGSALFLAAAYLAYIECWRSTGAWQPQRLVWWICIVNLIGCIAFLVSAFAAFVPETGQLAGLLSLSLLTTVIGAIAFLVGGLLLVPEPTL